jgi:parallel beta-helix repeat protein
LQPTQSRAARHARDRRPRVKILLGVGLILALVGALALSVRALTPAAPRRPAALLGAFVNGPSASSQQAAISRLEVAIGRRFAIGHSFIPWGGGLDRLSASNIAQGRTPLISFGDGARSQSVAAGRHDPYLRSLAQSISALGRPVMLRYGGDMDRWGRPGTVRSGAWFVAAWRHVHELFSAQGVSASWVWSPTADAFAGGVDAYWPGDGYVDWIGADGFNANGCDGRTGWRDFGTIFEAFYAWGSVRGKPLIISETGTVEDPSDPGRKAAWYVDAAGTLARSMPRVRAVVYFDRAGRCDWRPDTSARSMQGFIRLANDPFFGGSSGPSVPIPTPAPRSTVPPRTTVAPTRTSAPPTTDLAPRAPGAAASCARGGVPIGPGDIGQRIVEAHGAGTTYVLKTGTHLRNFSVQPKPGDTFCGEPGAVLDGGRSLRSAFSGPATNVTLDSITVQNYATGRQGGAIQPDRHATGWVVRRVSALHNEWAGLVASDGMRILGGHYNDNEQLGIGGNTTTGIVLDGLDSDPSTFDGPEMARNHALHASCDWESGGMKWDVGRVTIRNAHVHDNDCKGLWADINAHDALIEHNLIEDNRQEGIFYEISRDGVIRNNQVHGNGFGGNGWYWAGGITVASSSGVEVYGNRLSGNYNGITGTQQDRRDSTPPLHLLEDYYVHDNLICATRNHPTGVAADNGANLVARDISLTDNSITSNGCR